MQLIHLALQFASHPLDAHGIFNDDSLWLPLESGVRNDLRQRVLIEASAHHVENEKLSAINQCGDDYRVVGPVLH